MTRVHFHCDSPSHLIAKKRQALTRNRISLQFLPVDDDAFAVDLQMVTGNCYYPSDKLSGTSWRWVVIHNQVPTLRNMIARHQLPCQEAVSWKKGRTHAAGRDLERFV